MEDSAGGGSAGLNADYQELAQIRSAFLSAAGVFGRERSDVNRVGGVLAGAAGPYADPVSAAGEWFSVAWSQVLAASEVSVRVCAGNVGRFTVEVQALDRSLASAITEWTPMPVPIRAGAGAR